MTPKVSELKSKRNRQCQNLRNNCKDYIVTCIDGGMPGTNIFKRCQEGLVGCEIPVQQREEQHRETLHLQ